MGVAPVSARHWCGYSPMTVPVPEPSRAVVVYVYVVATRLVAWLYAYDTRVPVTWLCAYVP
nr:hypothetical protein GCM10020092_055640 [Actinoplanes digitatis]